MNGQRSRVSPGRQLIAAGRRHGARAVRLAQLVAARLGANAADALQRKSAALEIRLDGLHKGLAVKPVSDIPAPMLDLAACDNPVTAIMAAPEFAAATALFEENPVAARSLVSPQAQALLYGLIRNLKPEHVFEIGSYKGGTTEAICRALYANGRGLAHTVDPFRGEYVAAVLRHWPPELFRHVRLHAKDSMAFYKDMEREHIRPGVVFVDGNHDYEFAAFDIAYGARLIAPGGYIFVDNVAQPGPFFAARDFLVANPGWRELGRAATDYDRSKAFDRWRTTILYTDFMVLRAPLTRQVGERPLNLTRRRWWSSKVDGVRLKVKPPAAPGTLSVQVVLRGFGTVPAEAIGAASISIGSGSSELTVALDPPARLDGAFVYFTVEPWLIWQGPQPLQLIDAPQPY
jgi:predicted O-methyltransferase YrrM